MIEAPISATESIANIERAAEKLACALASLPQFLEYLRVERAVHDDPQAAEIKRHISAYGELYFSFEEVPASLTELREQFSALPVVCEWRAAEAELRAAFTLVDELVVQAVGLPFAGNIRACGST